MERTGCVAVNEEVREIRGGEGIEGVTVAMAMGAVCVVYVEARQPHAIRLGWARGAGCKGGVVRASLSVPDSEARGWMDGVRFVLLVPEEHLPQICCARATAEARDLQRPRRGRGLLGDGPSRCSQVSTRAVSRGRAS
jgi:hypothetical protein